MLGTRGRHVLDRRVILLLAPLIDDILTYIYNLCTYKAVFLEFSKSGKLSLSTSTVTKQTFLYYKPVSVLPFLSKSLEKHIHKHTLKSLNDNKLIHPN